MPAARRYLSGAVAVVAALIASSPAYAQQGTIYYSGTVTWTGRWQFSNSNTSGSGGENVTATIDSGAALSAVAGPTRVTCSGNGWAKGDGTEEWTISRRGMVDIVTAPTAPLLAPGRTRSASRAGSTASQKGPSAAPTCSSKA